MLSIRGSLSRAKPRGDTTEPRNGLENAEINKRHNIVDHIIRERERERERQRERETKRERDKERERQRERETKRERDRERQRERQRERGVKNNK